MRDVWFPAVESKNVVGRFVDVDTVDPVRSQQEQREVLKRVTVLQSKVVGSHDVSHDRVKPFNKDAFTSRFPGAWPHYEKMKAQPVVDDAVPVLQGEISGTPLDKADFLPRDRISWLHHQGIQTIEQIRDLSDAQCQNIQGASKWRRQARDFLART